MGFAELQVAVLEISLREGAQLCSKSAERPGLWQPSLSELAECRQLEKAPLLWAPGRGCDVAESLILRNWASQGENQTNQETRKWKCKYYCKPLDVISLSPFLKKLMKNALAWHLGLEGPGFQHLGIYLKCGSIWGCRSSVSCFVFMIWWHSVFRGVGSQAGLGPAVLFLRCPGFLTRRLSGWCWVVSCCPLRRWTEFDFLLGSTHSPCVVLVA